MRYAGAREFPAYAFLPGRDPHPVRDPRGHSHGLPEAEALYLPAEAWASNEAWEGLWHKAKHDPDQKDHLQGLIQCAAGCLKIPMGQPRGLSRLVALGSEKLSRVAHSHAGLYMGIHLFEFVQEIRAFACADPGPTSIDGRPRIELEGLEGA